MKDCSWDWKEIEGRIKGETEEKFWETYSMQELGERLNERLGRY